MWRTYLVLSSLLQPMHHHTSICNARSTKSTDRVASRPRPDEIFRAGADPEKSLVPRWWSPLDKSALAALVLLY